MPALSGSSRSVMRQTEFARSRRRSILSRGMALPAPKVASAFPEADCSSVASLWRSAGVKRAPPRGAASFLAASCATQGAQEVGRWTARDLPDLPQLAFGAGEGEPVRVRHVPVVGKAVGDVVLVAQSQVRLPGRGIGPGIPARPGLLLESFEEPSRPRLRAVGFDLDAVPLRPRHQRHDVGAVPRRGPGRRRGYRPGRRPSARRLPSLLPPTASTKRCLCARPSRPGDLAPLLGRTPRARRPARGPRGG